MRAAPWPKGCGCGWGSGSRVRARGGGRSAGAHLSRRREPTCPERRSIDRSSRALHAACGVAQNRRSRGAHLRHSCRAPCAPAVPAPLDYARDDRVTGLALTQSAPIHLTPQFTLWLRSGQAQDRLTRGAQLRCSCRAPCAPAVPAPLDYARDERVLGLAWTRTARLEFALSLPGVGRTNERGPGFGSVSASPLRPSASLRTNEIRSRRGHSPWRSEAMTNLQHRTPSPCPLPPGRR